MKITTQLRATVIGLSVVAIGSLASVYLNNIGNNSRIVNYSGIVRGASQRLVKLELANQESDELIARLDQIINGLINGDEELNLPKATDPAYLLKMQEVEASWQEIKEAIALVRQNPSYEDELLADSEALFELTNESVFAAEDFAKAAATRVRMVQLLIFGINLIIIGLIWYTTRQIAATLKRSTSSIAGSTSEITATMVQQESTIHEQAASITQTTATMEELGASTLQSTKQAEASSKGASQALELAEEGNKSVEETLAGISNLKEQVSSIAEQIMRLSEQTGQISLVSELVGNIASQTNVLALNASVEAARAGEAGEGFSVVAGEIRSLADQSKKSAEKINGLVRDIQASLNSAVMVTDEGTKKADAGIQLTQQTAQSFAGLAEAINDVSVNTQQITMTTKQQAVAVQHVVSAMNEITAAIQETAAGINQVNTSNKLLDEEAQNLKASV